MTEIIEGIPDAVSMRCLALVPFNEHPKLELVSRSWRAAIHNPELFKARKELNKSENFICVCAFEPDNIWQLYDPEHNLWMTLPILPSNIRHLAHFGVVSTSGKLFVLGGGSDAVDPLTGDHDGRFATDEVWSYDPVTKQWSRNTSMIVPRAMFACCVLNGKIVVAGGFTTSRKSISEAEIYDPETDTWTKIPNLHCTHNSACSGIVINGSVHVMHKGLSNVQILENNVENGGTWKWTVREYGWLQGPMAVVNGELYVISQNLVYKQETDSRKVVASATEFMKRIDFGMTGLGDEIYVIGGVIGPERWNWNIRLVSDVDVLVVGNGDRLGWRRAAPMTLCRGTILGCTQLKI